MSPIPLNIPGSFWTDGYAFDVHITRSFFIGYDDNGRDLFDSTRSQVGQLLYEMKYNGHRDTSDQIMEIISPFLDDWLTRIKIDCVLPVPATKPRSTQPVYVIAQKIALRYNLPYDSSVLSKNTDVESKTLQRENKDMTGAIDIHMHANRPKNILLVDDLFSTGATANECARVLKSDSLVENVYLFTVTRTK